jgi:glycosyltransferase involved in cell wall biosynthesis
MAFGLLAIVAAAYGGPAELVDHSTGIRVAFIDEASLTEELKNAIFHVCLLSRHSTGTWLDRAEICQRETDLGCCFRATIHKWD